jgi:hypothetical protein
LISAYEEARVGLLLIVGGAMMHDLAVSLQLGVQLLAVPVHVSQVQRPEILVVALVYQLLIDVQHSVVFF